MKNIFDFCEKLIDKYQLFSSSFAHPRARDISECISHAHQAHRFWPDALIQINPNYKRCDNIQSLADQGVVSRKCAEIFQIAKGGDSGSLVPITLYHHQQNALEMVKGGKSYVVTTGTGSGKSLAFFIPIINQILQEKEKDNTPRIRAIIVYPMNALANSQLEEIHKFLRSSPAVRVARYTGQEKDDERTNIKNNPPDILLTNYVMLDLILTRYHADHAIVQAAQNLEFLVLDELHTYRGRQGADVAMLVRRLRTQLNAADMICIGTSATMASVGSEDDRKTAVAKVASKLFDTEISPENVIMEVLEYVTGNLKDDQLKALLPQRIKNGKNDWANTEEFKNDPLAIWTERHLGIVVNPGDQKTLERARPMTLKEAAEKLSQEAAVSQTEAEQALKDFLIAMYLGKNWENGQPPFAFKLHQFLSGPGQIMTSLEPVSKRSVELDAQRFAPGGQQEQKHLYSTHFCRFCGQEYLPVWLENTNGKKKITPRDIREEQHSEEEDTSITAGFLCPAESLNEDSVFNVSTTCTDEQKYACLPDSWFTVNAQGDRVPARTYGKRIPELIHVAPDGTVTSGETPFWFLPGKHTFCLQCGQFYDSSLGRDSNRLVGLSGEGRSSATTALTFSALELMYQEKTGKSINKLLGFTDNRQDAALQAGHFNEFIFMVLLRSALLRALKLAPDHSISATEIAADVFKALGFDNRDQEMLNNYLLNPRLRGLQLANSQEALRFMLGYRLFEDLGREWRFNNPNLEQLQILKIEYQEIENLAKDEELFQGNNLLMSLTPEKRRQFAQIIFDYLRQSYCIQTHYFEQTAQEKARNQGDNTLLENWQMPERSGESLAYTKSLIIYKDRKNSLNQNKNCKEAAEKLDHNSAVKGSYNTKFMKLLIHGDIGGGHSLWEQTKYTDETKRQDFNTDKHDKELLLQAAIAMLKAANDYGIVTCTSLGTPEDPVESCALMDNAILWTLNPSENASRTSSRADSSITNDFFKDLYNQVSEQLGQPDSSIYSYEAQEHTAQVDAEYREALEYRFRGAATDQEKFKKEFPEASFKKLPVLYCSPTMELGVDISTLDMVYMRNVPPTPANYAQRSGRAGRSGQAALVVTYCAALSPHDQWFFSDDHIHDMVHGEVCVPALDLTNQDLVESHLRAAWLSCVKIDLPTKIKDLLDMEQKDCLPLKEEYRQALTDTTARTEAVSLVKKIMNRLLSKEFMNQIPPWYEPGFEEKVVGKAPQIFDRALDRWRNLYQSTLAQSERLHLLTISPNITKPERERVLAMYQDASRQLEELSGSSKNSDFYLYRYLASEGVLPGYSFPRLPVTAWIHRGNAVKKKLRHNEDRLGAMISRPRFLALSEFGPMSLIYHEGHTFSVCRVKLRASDTGTNGEVGTTTARICPRCGRGHFGEENSDGITNCIGCNSPLKSISVMRNLYQVEAVEAKPATRISLQDEERQRKGYDILSTYGFEHSPQILNISSGSKNLLHLEYSTAAKIQRINCGWRRRRNLADYGFWMDPSSGDWVNDQQENNQNSSRQPRNNKPAARPVKIVPYVQDHRNAMVITPDDNLKLDSGALCTLVAALLRGLEHVFQLEPGEIAAEPIPNVQTAHSLLFYEATEGGAGVLGQLINSEDRISIIRKIAVCALETMHYHFDSETRAWEENDKHCEAGCYKCLLSYFNQPQHEIINRRNPDVLGLLQELTVLSEDDLKNNSEAEATSGRQQFFHQLLVKHGLNLPDALPRSFNKAGMHPDAWYKSSRTVCFFDTPSSEIIDYCEEKGISILQFPSSDTEKLLQFISEHTDIFGTPVN